VPNRRRRRLSTATSAVAALAVASPFAYIAISNLSADIKPAPQHREFVRAAEMTDLPGELMGALSQGLSQFGVTIPPVPSLTGATSPSSLASPGLTSPGFGTPGLASPGLAAPGLTTPGLTTPGLTPGATPGLTPGLTDPSLANPGLTSPGLTSGPTSPTGFGPAGAGGLSNPSELPISDPIGLDPGAGGTYPILGDPSLGGAPSGGSGGLVSDMMSAANQLGAGQAIDLLKGMIMPGLMNAAHGAAAPAAPPALPAPPIP
jgi:hypothetical protein